MKDKQRKGHAESKERFTDERIIDLYWERNEMAITATDEKYRNFLFTIAYNIVHDDLDCEECLNDTYLGAWNSIPPTRPTILSAFLSKIVRNIAVNRFKKNHAAKAVPGELVVSLEELDPYMRSDMSLDEEIAIQQLSNALNRYLREMDERDRLVFMCRYYYADKIIEIAEMLGVSRNTVTKYLSDIREALKEHLIREGLWHE